MNLPLTTNRLRAAIRLPPSELRIGMFVSGLDCGWQGTPFLLEGVLLGTLEEIAIIGTVAKAVTVDPSRSRLDVFSPEQMALLYVDEPIRGLHATVPLPAVAIPVSVAVPSAEQFAQRIETILPSDAPSGKAVWLQRVVVWLQELGLVYNRATAKVKPVRKTARPRFIPDSFELVQYPDPEPTTMAIPKAMAACDMSEKVLMRIAGSIRSNGTVDMHSLQSAADTLVENMVARPATMMLAARMRNENDRIYQHGLGVAIYLTMLGRQLGFQREPLAELATVGLLLDLGKMSLDQAMLDKPGALSAEEHAIMRTHVELGVAKLAAGGVTSTLVLRAIGEHHERVDGSGYPNGSSSADITIYGKMAAIADAFVAMVGDRPYAPTMSTYDALRALFAEAGTNLYEPLVEQFVQSIGVFPVGSLIELSTGEVAIVVEDNRFRRLEPKILILTDCDKKQVKAPWSMDMMKHNFSIAPNTVRILRGLADGAHGVSFREYYLRRR